MKDYRVNLYSSVLNRHVPIRMIVPKGSNLKCLFLLHGYDGDHNQWCESSNIKRLAQQHEMVVVMPSCGNGYYEDTLEDIPCFVGKELVSYVRKELPVSGCRSDLYIAGVSMGGFGALLIGAKFPSVFGKVASLSGAFIISDVAIGNQGVLGNANPEYFKRIFGDLSVLEGSDRDPVAVAIREAERGSMPPVCLVCGNQDVLYNGNRKAAKALRDSGIPVVWFDGLGTHSWPFWNRMLPLIMTWLASC